MAFHTVCHIEWEVSDLKKAQKFYGSLFPDWKFEIWGEDYLIWTPPGELGGGLQLAKKVTPAKNPILYFNVEKIEPYLEKVISLGGTIELGISEIPQIGWYANVLDPDGNRFAFFKALPKA
jgi:predicted enzyme related to lactoylglutathione lyase